MFNTVSFDGTVNLFALIPATSTQLITRRIEKLDTIYLKLMLSRVTSSFWVAIRSKTICSSRFLQQGFGNFVVLIDNDSLDQSSLNEGDINETLDKLILRPTTG